MALIWFDSSMYSHMSSQFIWPSKAPQAIFPSTFERFFTSVCPDMCFKVTWFGVGFSTFWITTYLYDFVTLALIPSLMVYSVKLTKGSPGQVSLNQCLLNLSEIIPFLICFVNSKHHQLISCKKTSFCDYIHISIFNSCFKTAGNKFMIHDAFLQWYLKKNRWKN